MSGQHIIMNFSVPPSLDDLQIMSAEILQTLPDEMLEYVEDLDVEIEDFPDTAVEQELDMNDPFDVLALFRSGKEITPGVEVKSGKDANGLILYRRPILDMWCETCDDLFGIVRQAIIEELGRHFELPDTDIEEYVSRHHQGML